MSNLPTLAKGPVLLPGTFNKDAIVFIDAEVSPETGQIVDLGACRADGRFFHSSNVAAFKEFCKGADFVCGHNIVAFDMQYLRPVLGDGPQAVDTLPLSALLFPRKRFHNLLKDEKRSKELEKYVSMLPELQKMLPCPDEYKTFVPGTSSDLNVYDAIYYAGDCNCGSKTIAINLPNDDRVQALKGARRLQLHNSMNAKFGKILLPIGRLLIEPDQQKHLRSEAFFWNVTFHEVAHGLGVKETVNGKGKVDDAMGAEKTTWEEAKADILGLFMVCRLIDMKEIPLISKEDAITTFIAGLVRSVRFGSASSHGKANMMCYNFMKENGAFSRNKDGQYHIDYEKALKAIDDWAGLIIKTQATGDAEFARTFSAEYAVVPEALSADIANINAHNIPRDIKFDFVW